MKSFDGGYTTMLRMNRNKLLFGAQDGTRYGLWRSDGTQAHTRLVKRFGPAATTSPPNGFVKVGKRVLFYADDGTSGAELWRTDGTRGHTKRVKDINSGPDGSNLHFNGGLEVFRGHAYFEATDGTPGYKIWRSDGTNAGTKPFKALADAGGYFKVNRRHAIFTGEDPMHGVALWKTDGTIGGTHILKDFSDIATFYYVPPGKLHGKAYFGADGGLWRSDGTLAHTRKVGGTLGLGGTPAVRLGNRLLFNANDGMHGSELWRTDGTNAGTQLVRDITIGPDAGDPSYFKRLGKRAYFSGEKAGDRELWRTDGTRDGTRLVKDINPSSSSVPACFFRVGPRLLFSAVGVNVGRELFSTKGTAATTRLVKDLRSGPAGSYSLSCD